MSTKKEEDINISHQNEKTSEYEKEINNDNSISSKNEPYTKKIISKKEINNSKPLIKKDKDEYIEKLQLEISDYKNDIELLKAKNLELNNKLIENNELLEKYELENNIKENENSKALLILENKINTLTKEKKDLEDKTKELILIINQYSKEVKDLSNKNKILQDENKNFYNQNLNLNEDLKEKTLNLNEILTKNDKLNEIISGGENKDEIIKAQKEEIEKLKNEYEKKIKNQEKLIEELNNFKSKASQNEELQKKYNDISADLASTQNNFKDIKNINDLNLKRAEECESALNSQTININKNIVNLIECINNFFEEEMHIDEDLPIDQKNEYNEKDKNEDNGKNTNDCPILINIENVKFNLLLECLKNKKLNLKNYIKYINNNKNNSEKENKENKSKINELNKEIKELSKQNDILTEDKNNLLNELNVLRNYLNEINDNVISSEKENEMLRSHIFTSSPDKSNTFEMPFKQSIEDQNNNYNDDIDIQMLKEEIINLKNENKNLNDTKELLEKELDSIKNNNYDFIYNNPLLNMSNNKNDEEKIKLDLIIDKYNQKLYKFENENNDLKFKNQLLKEKLKKYQDENEAYYNNSSYNKSIKKLQSQKDSLINDNVLLFDNNKNLKNELCNLSNEIDKIKYSPNYSQISNLPKMDYNNNNSKYNDYYQSIYRY